MRWLRMMRSGSGEGVSVRLREMVWRDVSAIRVGRLLDVEEEEGEEEEVEGREGCMSDPGWVVKRLCEFSRG